MEINKKNGTHHAVKFNLTVVSEEVAWSLLAGWAWKVNNLLSAELQSYDTETPVYCSTSSPYIVKPSQWGPRYKDCSLSSIVQHGAPPETSPAAAQFFRWPWRPPSLTTRRTSWPCRRQPGQSSTTTSTPLLTSGRPLVNIPPRRSSRSWGRLDCWGWTNLWSTAASASTSSTAWPSTRPSATSGAGLFPCPSRFRQTWPPQPSPGKLAVSVTQ